MRNQQHGTAFSEEFLKRLHERDDDSSTAQEADLAGPWDVESASGGYAVIRSGLGAADPLAFFSRRDNALLVAALLPAVGAEPLWGLSTEHTDEGFALETRWGDQWVVPAGFLSQYKPELVETLHLADSLIRSPRSLALLLEAAGPTALRLAGQYLAARLVEPND